MAITRTTNFQPGAERYLFDFRLCTYAQGWAQVDTRQDAPYFGTWTNPTRRALFTYCEGDTTLVTCETDEEYRAELASLKDWNTASGYWLGIDPGLDPAMRQCFVALGLEPLLH